MLIFIFKCLYLCLNVCIYILMFIFIFKWMQKTISEDFLLTFKKKKTFIYTEFNQSYIYRQIFFN